MESKAYVAPTNDTEAMLAAIYESNLNIDQVSIHDNFFEIGGHSLKAIGIINKIEATNGVRLPLKAMFENQQ